MFAYLNYRKFNLRTLKNLPALNQQRGTILILVLLIVALVAGLSIKFAGDYQLGLARAETRWFGAQMRAYFLSGEAVATNMLSNDPADTDNRAEEWASYSDGVTFPVEGGDITVSFSDPNSLLDLNALVVNKLDPNKPLTDPTKYDQPQRMFIRLLQEFPDLVHSPDEAAAILQSVVYWAQVVDPTSVGEDDQYYASQEVAYRAPHTGNFRSIEELQLVRGISPELMRVLRQYVNVMYGDTKMNINTMPVELIRAINFRNDLRPLDASTAEHLYSELYDKPVKQQPELASLMSAYFGQGTEVDNDFNNKTQYFWLKMIVHMGDQFRIQQSLLMRGYKGTPFTVQRREEQF